MKTHEHYLTSIIHNHPRFTAEDVKTYCRSSMIPFRIDSSGAVCIRFGAQWLPVQWCWRSGQFYGNKFDLFVVVPD